MDSVSFPSVLGNADELSPVAVAELNEWIDARNADLAMEDFDQMQADLAMASAPTPRVVKVVTAAGKRFKASVEIDGRKVKCGTWLTESQAWLACESAVRNEQPAA